MKVVLKEINKLKKSSANASFRTVVIGLKNKIYFFESSFIVASVFISKASLEMLRGVVAAKLKLSISMIVIGTYAFSRKRCGKKKK